MVRMRLRSSEIRARYFSISYLALIERSKLRSLGNFVTKERQPRDGANIEQGRRHRAARKTESVHAFTPEIASRA